MKKKSTDICIGIIGAGIMGSGHALYISESVKGARVAGIYDANTTVAMKVASKVKKIGGLSVTVYDSIQSMLAAKEITAIIIASPDNLHAEHLSMAVAAGKDVLCEKPLASNDSDAKKVAQTANKSKSIVGIGFMRRFDPAYLELKRVVRSGKYGKVLQIRCTSRNVSSPTATTAMLLTNVAVHEVDVIRWLLDEEIKSVNVNLTKVTSKANSKLLDPISVNCYTESGVLATIDICANSTYGYEVGMEVITESASLVVENLGELTIVKDFYLPNRKSGKLHKDWMGRFKPAYIAELNAFVESIKKRKLHPNFATANDGLAASIACGLGVKSLPRNQR
jgi:myo-inositol 2-dehydrogenase / D-chiro-inositol 1-dehydrogenase